MKKILFVCHGNICRSPMAEGIMKHKAMDAGIRLEIDSAGFEPFHLGDAPDPRSILTMKKHGIDIRNLRSRLMKPEDYKKFDFIFVMDTVNYKNALYLAHHEADKQKLDYIMNVCDSGKNIEVPDPYYGKGDGFERVYQMLDKACDAILKIIKD